MFNNISEYDPKITIEWLQSEPESLYFEKKGLGETDLKPTKLANELIGMLNADGGVVVFGVSDRGELQDLSTLGEDKLDQYRKVCQQFIRPAPRIRLEEVKVNGGLIFLYHVENNYEEVYRRKDTGKVYKRGGTSTFELDLDDIRNLEYDKNLRAYEDKVIEEFDPADFDLSLLQEYKSKINYAGSNDDLLVYRNLAKRNKDGSVSYCNSAVLLFAIDPDKYIPSSYIRYVRFNGEYAGVGKKYNVTKDTRINGNIPTLIRQTRDLLRHSLSDFYFYDPVTNTFQKRPEYPEDAWIEGIVNSVFHRSYNLQGNCVMIKHYDNRLEISNSGPLPAQVTVENIKDQRYSRNPRIGRVLYEMEYVRELNEGVNRIYSSMDEYRLRTEYTDQDDIVTLKLINGAHSNEKNLPESFYSQLEEKLEHYNETRRKIVVYILENGHGTIHDIATNVGTTTRTTRYHLKRLCEDGILLKKSDKSRDINAQYIFNVK